VRPPLSLTHNFAFLEHSPSKSLRVEIIHTTNLRTAHLSSYTLQKPHVTHDWPTSSTRCSSAVILLAGLHLVRIARLALFSSLTIHLVGVPRLPSFSLPDNISYALLVWPHSPCWPLLLRTSLPQTYVRTFARNAMLGITCLLLVRVARLLSFS